MLGLGFGLDLGLGLGLGFGLVLGLGFCLCLGQVSSTTLQVPPGHEVDGGTGGLKFWRPKAILVRKMAPD